VFTEASFVRKPKIPESEYTQPLFYALLFNSPVPVSFTPLASLHELLIYVLPFSV